jgi:hypothetical protein
MQALIARRKVEKKEKYFENLILCHKATLVKFPVSIVDPS